MLQDLLRSTPTEVEAEYLKDSAFFITFKYLSSAEIEKAVQAQKMAFRAGKVETKGFTDALRAAVANSITNWRGLTKSVLLRMDMDLDLEKLNKAEFDELPCTPEIKLAMLKADATFFEWCQSICMEIATMRELKARQEEKNLQTL